MKTVLNEGSPLGNPLDCDLFFTVGGWLPVAFLNGVMPLFNQETGRRNSN